MEETRQVQVVELEPRQKQENGNVQPVEVIDYVPSPVITPEDAKRNLERLDEIKEDILRKGVDYNTIPGTPKPTLLKPGAERLLQFFGLGHRVQCVEKVEDWEKGFFYYRYKVSVVKTYPTYEIIVAECEGSANSKESRYAYRWIPEFRLKEQGITSTDGLEYRTKKGRYGTYKEYKVPNPDPYSLVNTLQKMAIKRALVGAALQATGTSEFFTQDVEDIEGAAREAITEAETPPHPQEEPKETNQPKTSQQKTNRQPQNGQQTAQQNGEEPKASEGQWKRIFAAGYEKGLTKERILKLVDYLCNRKVSDKNPLTKKEAHKIIDIIQGKKEDESWSAYLMRIEIQSGLKELGVE